MMDWKTYREDNLKSWNSRTPEHVQSAFYDVPGFLEGNEALMAPELELLTDVQGKTLLHLQCHFGMDTLAWARKGALVTGLDFSDTAIDAALHLRDQTGLNAQFICSDVYLLEQHLPPETFDIVYTSYGAICWLPDLEEWANLIFRQLKPGGRLVFVEFHPVLYLFDFNTKALGYPYFAHQHPLTEETKGTYASPDANLKLRDHFWSHPISEVLTCLLQSGLEISRFSEWDYSPYPCFENMTKISEQKYRWENGPYPLPHVYGIIAKKPLSSVI